LALLDARREQLKEERKQLDAAQSRVRELETLVAQVNDTLTPFVAMLKKAAADAEGG
jgi:hypothetical protein